MTKRFSVRKIKVNSYSCQGWVMSHRESFAVTDRMWQQRPRGYLSIWEAKSKFLYVQNTEWNNKAFVQAIADYLNETVGLDFEKRIDGFIAYQEGLKRDVGHCGCNSYKEWCDKFST